MEQSLQVTILEEHRGAIESILHSDDSGPGAVLPGLGPRDAKVLEPQGARSESCTGFATKAFSHAVKKIAVWVALAL